MKPDEGDYVIACVVPANAPGVKIVSVVSPPQGDLRGSPVAAKRYNAQDFVIFEDVFVPYDRIFLDGDQTRRRRNVPEHTVPTVRNMTVSASAG